MVELTALVGTTEPVSKLVNFSELLALAAPQEEDCLFLLGLVGKDPSLGLEETELEELARFLLKGAGE